MRINGIAPRGQVRRNNISLLKHELKPNKAVQPPTMSNPLGSNSLQRRPDMKRFLTASVAVLILAGSAGAASAQDHRRDYNNNGHYDNRDRAYDQGRHDQARAEDRQDRREYRRWAKGQRLDSRYRGNTYYVSDYRARGLRQPPRGYRWQKVDNQYVLAAVATGLIASVILANR
jgi:Ni/Co efflux regulator RcnB